MARTGYRDLDSINDPTGSFARGSTKWADYMSGLGTGRNRQPELPGDEFEAAGWRAAENMWMSGTSFARGLGYRQPSTKKAFENSYAGLAAGNSPAAEPYKRPFGTTMAQKRSVQGKPCVECGRISSTQFADHRTPLVREYYTTGRIDAARAKSVDAVQPHCSSCSARQGYDLMRYSLEQRMKNFGH